MSNYREIWEQINQRKSDPSDWAPDPPAWTQEWPTEPKYLVK